MKKEIERMKELNNFEEPIENYFRILSKEKQTQVFREFQSQIDQIENFFYNEDDTILSTMPPESRIILMLYQESLAKLKVQEHVKYQERVNAIISKIKNLSLSPT